MIFRQRDFTGGENLKLLSEFLQPNQLIAAHNCELTAEGLVQTRQGKVKINTTSLGTGGILSAYVYPKENGTNYLVAQHGTSLYAEDWDGAGFTAFPAAVKITLGTGKLRGQVWKDNLLLASSTVAPFRFDGATCTDLGGTPPNFSQIFIYANRAWGIVAANPNLLRFSDLENFDSWPALNVINVRDGDGDHITACASTPGGLLIAKTRSVFALYGTNRDNMQLSEPLSRVGCMSPDAFLPGVMQGLDNWYQVALNGTQALPETHTPLLDLLTVAQKSAVIGHFHNLSKRALFHLPNGRTVVMDGKYQGITTWTGLNIGCMTSADAEGLDSALIIGDASDGLLFTLSGNDDNGSSIQTLIKTNYTDHGSEKEKIWRHFTPHMEIIDQSANYEIFARYDVDYRNLTGLKTFAGTLPNVFEWNTDDWNTAYWGTGTGLTQLNNPYWLHGVRGGFVSFEIKTNNRIKLRGYETDVQLTNRMAGVR